MSAQLEWQRPQANLGKTKQEEQFARQMNARERANRESMAAQLNLYGDIVKNVAPKFPSDMQTFQYSLRVLKSYSNIL